MTPHHVPADDGEEREVGRGNPSQGGDANSELDEGTEDISAPGGDSSAPSSGSVTAALFTLVEAQGLFRTPD